MISYTSNMDLFKHVDKEIKRVADNAGDDWKAVAFEKVAEYAKQSQAPFLTEDIREWCLESIPEPHDGRAWGQIMRKAQKQGIICKVGFYSAKSSNLSPKVLWNKVEE